ncbi:MAG: hypothetical protein L3J56_00790 [Bacteroidales bacterium]|nr:hypothetical protein [Bacteroidales bacterium]
MKSGFIIYVFAIVFCGYSCNCINDTVKRNKSEILNYKKVAFKKYGNDTTFTFSPGRKYVLCQKKINKDNLNPDVLSEFFVYDLKRNKIIYEDKISNSAITWFSGTELKISVQKGIIYSPADNGKIIYIYNLKTHKKNIFQKKIIINK